MQNDVGIVRWGYGAGLRHTSGTRDSRHTYSWNEEIEEKKNELRIQETKWLLHTNEQQTEENKHSYVNEKSQAYANSRQKSIYLFKNCVILLETIVSLPHVANNFQFGDSREWERDYESLPFRSNLIFLNTSVVSFVLYSLLNAEITS